MTTVNANVTAGKTFVPDANGKYQVTVDGLHQGFVPTVTVNMLGQIVNEDISDAAAIEQIKMAEMAVDGLQQKRIARATYDFSVHGGASGTINLGLASGAASAVQLPDNAVIVRSWWDVTTQLTSGGAAQISFGAESAVDIQTAAVLGTHGTAGFHEGIQDVAAANFSKTTQARNLTMTITVADLTAGVLTLFVEYVVSL